MSTTGCRDCTDTVGLILWSLSDVNQVHEQTELVCDSLFLPVVPSRQVWCDPELTDWWWHRLLHSSHTAEAESLTVADATEVSCNSRGALVWGPTPAVERRLVQQVGGPGEFCEAGGNSSWRLRVCFHHQLTVEVNSKIVHWFYCVDESGASIQVQVTIS